MALRAPRQPCWTQGTSVPGYAKRSPWRYAPPTAGLLGARCCPLWAMPRALLQALLRAIRPGLARERNFPEAGHTVTCNC
jgi:hypothetical protein